MSLLSVNDHRIILENLKSDGVSLCPISPTVIQELRTTSFTGLISRRVARELQDLIQKDDDIDGHLRITYNKDTWSDQYACLRVEVTPWLEASGM